MQLPIRYLAYLLMGLRLASTFCMWIASIHCLQFCSPYFGSLISIFLFPKVISYPWILTTHFLCIFLSIGLPWIASFIFQTDNMLLGLQEKLICIRLLIGLLFRYLCHCIPIVSLQMSVELNSYQMRWVSGTILQWIAGFLVKYLFLVEKYNAKMMNWMIGSGFTIWRMRWGVGTNNLWASDC